MKQRKQKIKKPKDPRPFAQRHPKWNTFFAFIILILLGIGAFFLLKIIGKGKLLSMSINDFVSRR